MPDKRKNIPDDELEFHYSEADDETRAEGQSYAEPEPMSPSKPLWQRLFSRRVVIIIGVIVAVAIVYYFTKPPIQVERASSTGQNASIASSPSEVSNSQNVSSLERDLMQTDRLLKQQLDSLSKQNDDDDDKIALLQQSLLGVNRNLNQLQQSVNDLASTVQNLQQQVSRQQIQMRRSSTAEKTAAKMSSKPAQPAISYQLQAVVPGRAWLRASNGKTLTVKVGDQLKGYGVVRAINAERGIVGTSSGKLIEYGPQDS